MSLSKFKKYKEAAPEEEIREVLEKLYRSFPIVKQYFTMELGTEKERATLNGKAKKKLESLYQRYRTRSRKSKANTILKEQEAISVFDHELADVYLYHVELCLDWLRYFDVKPMEADHMLQSLDKAIQLILKSMSEDQFEDRLNSINQRANILYHYGQQVSEIIDKLDG